MMEATSFALASEMSRTWLEAVRQSLAASADETAVRANATLGLLQKPELQAAAAENPALKERFAQIAGAAQTRLREAEARKAMYERVLAQWQKDLAEIG